MRLSASGPRSTSRPSSTSARISGANCSSTARPINGRSGRNGIPLLAWEYAKETFKVCLDAAQKRNVFYCIEPLTRSNTNFINTVEDATPVCQGNPAPPLQADV